MLDDIHAGGGSLPDDKARDLLTEQASQLIEEIRGTVEFYNAQQGGDSPVGAGGEPQALYEAALRQFRRGSYETARAGLDQFLEQYPSHELAPDAQYFRAETFAESGEPDVALVEYARVLELYPNSRRAPTALYKSGLIELQRGNVDDARTFFQRVVQGYPDSDEVDLAEWELSRLQN